MVLLKSCSLIIEMLDTDRTLYQFLLNRIDMAVKFQIFLHLDSVFQPSGLNVVDIELRVGRILGMEMLMQGFMLDDKIYDELDLKRSCFTSVFPAGIIRG